MRFIRVSRTRAVVVAVIALLLAVGVYAFAASNTVPGTEAGSGSGAISGYTVSSVAYGLSTLGVVGQYWLNRLGIRRSPLFAPK